MLWPDKGVRAAKKVGNPCSKPSLDLFPRKCTYAKVIELCNMVLWSIEFIANRYRIPPHQISLCPLLMLYLTIENVFENSGRGKMLGCPTPGCGICCQYFSASLRNKSCKRLGSRPIRSMKPGLSLLIFSQRTYSLSVLTQTSEQNLNNVVYAVFYQINKFP